MAESQLEPVMLTTNSKILVTVDEALHDIIVVSYAVESKLFQGVLLDSTKRYLPCRLPEESSQKTEGKTEEDKLYFSIRQRFTYFQEKPVVAHSNPLNSLHKKVSAKTAKSQKMTVRLRPRQVLCSKCKSICNENSENVNNTAQERDRKVEEPVAEHRPLTDRWDHMPNSSPSKLCPGFVPRVPRLKTETEAEVNGDELWFKDEEGDRGMVLRKKRSVGSMEDLWDETVFQEESSKKAKTTPVIKISFGSQGEGTVLKIPAKVQAPDEKPQSEDCTKAAKKAMKKAKKEAKRRILANASPARSTSPRSDSLQYRKHRHKVKHKKKHKMDKIDDMAEKCLKQKLSINLKRVSPTSYEKTSGSDQENREEDENQLTSEVPDFPSSDAVQDEGSSTQVVTSCQTVDGSTVTVGDIVWGKIHGFPWWPGKVLEIVIRTNSNSWHAHVSWYGSTTSSMMPCDQLSPFLQTFKVRYNRRKKSAGYKEAIRQATSEASASNPDLPVPEVLEEPSSAVS